MQKYDLIENKVASRLYGMTKSEAISYIKENELIPRVIKEDKVVYPKTHDFISHRLNLIIYRGKVISVEIG